LLLFSFAFAATLAVPKMIVVKAAANKVLIEVVITVYFNFLNLFVVVLNIRLQQAGKVAQVFGVLYQRRLIVDERP
jgi:hypothetical protein